MAVQGLHPINFICQLLSYPSYISFFFFVVLSFYLGAFSLYRAPSLSSLQRRFFFSGQDSSSSTKNLLLQQDPTSSVLSFVVSHLLRPHKLYYIPEASASLLIGKGCWIEVFRPSYLQWWFGINYDFCGRVDCLVLVYLVFSMVCLIDIPISF